jgi:Flp pilus assembly CpaF family ATPase
MTTLAAQILGLGPAHQQETPQLQNGAPAIKTSIADSLNIIVQMERRPGSRYVSEVLEIRGYAQEPDQYGLREVYVREASLCGRVP